MIHEQAVTIPVEKIASSVEEFATSMERFKFIEIVKENQQSILRINVGMELWQVVLWG